MNTAGGKIHPSAVLDHAAEIAEGVTIGPFAVIGAGARIGARTSIASHVVIGPNCVIGSDSIVHSHVTLYAGVVLGDCAAVRSGACLGPDGFGYTYVDGRHEKIAQVGRVITGDRLEVGANSTLDRGSIGDTELGDDVAIANLVHIGHNVRMGRSVSIDAHAGIAGSAIIGDRVLVGGHVAIVGHVTVGDGVEVARWGGVTQDIPPDENVAGTPAKPMEEARRLERLMAELPHELRRLRAIEQWASRRPAGEDDTLS